MEYRETREGELKKTNAIQIVIGDVRYRLTEEHSELIVTKIDFEDLTLIVKPKYSNVISIS